MKSLQLVCLVVLWALSAVAQDAKQPSASQPIVPHLIRFSGQLNGLSGTVGITFTLHKSQQDNAALWIETQNVKVDATGKYTVLLGATKPEGIAAELFTSGEAQWLGIHVEGRDAQPRVLLVSVPYALKAAEADTLAGHAISDFVTTDKLTTAVQQELKTSATSATTPKLKSNALASTATNFTDTTPNQVVNVAQNGTGIGLNATAINNNAIKGTSAGVAISGSSTETTGSGVGVNGKSASIAGVGVYGTTTATTGTANGVRGTSSSPFGAGVYGFNDATTGTGLRALASNSTGASTGLLTTVQSANGTAAILQNLGGGKLVSGQSGSLKTEVFSVDGGGQIRASGSILGKQNLLPNAPLMVAGADNQTNTAFTAAEMYGGDSYATGSCACYAGGLGLLIDGGNGIGATADGGTAIFATGGYTNSQPYPGDGIDAVGGHNYMKGGDSTYSGGIGVSSRGGETSASGAPGGQGIYSKGGEGDLGPGGLGVYGLGGSGDSGQGGTGIYGEGGTGSTRGGFGGEFKGGVMVYENNLSIQLGTTNCNVGFTGITFATTLITDCKHYSLLGDGSNTMINRASGGFIDFRENNVSQMTIATGGTVTIAGTLNAGTKHFVIDHPLDPLNKLLYHTSVESPDMKTLYDGVIVLNAKGEAWVTLPDYFEALNQDYRYVLTPIGRGAPYLHVAREVQGNRFKIAGGRANQKVSWQVTGIRHDAFANANRGPVEVEKTQDARGKYLHPEAFEQSTAEGGSR